MRKKLITAIITVALLIAGCSDTANVSEGQDRLMEKVEDEWGYTIYVDKDTNVMYIKGSGDGGTLQSCLTQMVHRRSGRERLSEWLIFRY